MIKRQIRNIFFLSLIFIFWNKKVFGGCFENKDVQTILLKKTPNINCLFVSPGSNCTGNLEIHIRNYCNEVIVYNGIYQKTELQKFNTKLP